jgi:hypothetical protein
VHVLIALHASGQFEGERINAGFWNCAPVHEEVDGFQACPAAVHSLQLTYSSWVAQLDEDEVENTEFAQVADVRLQTPKSVVDIAQN